MDVSINTSKIKVLQDFFNDLSEIDQRKVFMASYRKAAKPLVAKAKAESPHKTGQLMRSIGTIEYPQNVSIMVGAKLAGGAKKSGWYGNILEVGSYKVGERFRKKYKGKLLKTPASTGRLVATHFFENAYNSVQEEMYNTMAQEWYSAIDSKINSVNKKLR
jgi:HK97 gp10 family phage protein